MGCSTAVSFWTHRLSMSPWVWGSSSVRSATSGLTTTVRVGVAEPPACRRPRDPTIRGDGHIPGASDELPKPAAGALLRTRREDGMDHPPRTGGSQERLEETARESSREQDHPLLRNSSSRNCDTRNPNLTMPSLLLRYSRSMENSAKGFPAMSSGGGVLNVIA